MQQYAFASEGVSLDVQVCDKGKWFVSCKDVPMSLRNVVFPSMFPNGGNYKDDREKQLKTYKRLPGRGETFCNTAIKKAPVF